MKKRFIAILIMGDIYGAISRYNVLTLCTSSD